MLLDTHHNVQQAYFSLSVIEGDIRSASWKLETSLQSSEKQEESNMVHFFSFFFSFFFIFYFISFQTLSTSANDVLASARKKRRNSLGLEDEAKMIDIEGEHGFRQGYSSSSSF